MKIEERQIGEVGNYYGALCVKSEDGKHFWSIEDWQGHFWKEIPAYLFDALNRHQDELEVKA